MTPTHTPIDDAVRLPHRVTLWIKRTLICAD